VVKFEKLVVYNLTSKPNISSLKMIGSKYFNVKETIFPITSGFPVDQLCVRTFKR